MQGERLKDSEVRPVPLSAGCQVKIRGLVEGMMEYGKKYGILWNIGIKFRVKDCPVGAKYL